MTLDELRVDLALILAQEEQHDTDWAVVEALSEAAFVRLSEPETLKNFPREDVIVYLAGHQRRRFDRGFREQQRQWLRTFLRAH